MMLYLHLKTVSLVSLLSSPKIQNLFIEQPFDPDRSLAVDTAKDSGPLNPVLDL